MPFWPLTSLGPGQVVSIPSPLSDYTRLSAFLCSSVGQKPSKMGTGMLERIHRQILRIIQGPPIRSKASAAQLMLGTAPVSYQIANAFLVSIINIKQSSVVRHLFLARVSSPCPGSLISEYIRLLEDYNLPPISQLLVDHRTTNSWKASVKKFIQCHFMAWAVEDSDRYPLSICHFKISRPLKQWSITVGPTQATRQTIIRIRLLVGRC